MHDVRRMIGTHHVLLVTLDTLRFDVAQQSHRLGRTPQLSRWIGPDGWERRHSPGSFTYSAHASFFAGFLPTPARPGRHPRPFAMSFPGAETITEQTAVFDAPDLPTGLRCAGYHTVCIGGTGFFNRLSPLGNVFPSLFDEAHWSPALGVTDPRSTENQVAVALDRLQHSTADRPVFLFINVSAIHQPNCGYLPGASTDTIESHQSALEYVDRCLGVLFTALPRFGPWFAVVCSDHGTAYGEDGYYGHRCAHPVVWDVPYAEFVITGDRP